jgi:hypothetical protein
MKATVQARLDEESQHKLVQLVNRLGLSPSEVVREGLRVLAACRLGNGKRQIIGQGQFDSGIKDLGSNKEHLKGFGR